MEIHAINTIDIKRICVQHGAYSGNGKRRFKFDNSFKELLSIQQLILQKACELLKCFIETLFGLC